MLLLVKYIDSKDRIRLVEINEFDKDKIRSRLDDVKEICWAKKMIGRLSEDIFKK